MAYPTQPAGTVLTGNFGVNISNNAWTGDKPEAFYMYAIVPYIPMPLEWGGSKYEKIQGMSVSRAVGVSAGSYYDDSFTWISPLTGEVMLISTEPLADITDTREWTTRQTQTAQQAELVEPWFAWGTSFGVLEIACWDDTEELTGTNLYALSVEFKNDLAYDAPGASDVRQHVERIHADSVAPGYFASAYHAMWCVSASVNRCIYEDRHTNCWPICRYGFTI